jgi:hypothetical protein
MIFESYEEDMNRIATTVWDCNNRKPTIGKTVTRFWWGEKYVFIYCGHGEWECDKNPYPPQILDFV